MSEFGIIIDFKNLKAWTENYCIPFRDCFTKEYTMKYLKKFANDRFARLIDESDLELSVKEYKKREKEFSEYFIAEMERLIKNSPDGGIK